MIFDRDVFARLALYPKFISPQSGVFDLAFLIKFVESEDGRWQAMSVVNRTELRDARDVHSYGCRAAKHADNDFTRRKGRPPDEETEAHHYLGFYDFEWAAAKYAPVLYYEVSIRWKPEHGERAHFQVEMILPRGMVVSGAKKRKDRIAMRVALSSGLIGPMRYICDQDEEIRDRLEEISSTLPLMPLAG